MHYCSIVLDTDLTEIRQCCDIKVWQNIDESTISPQATTVGGQLVIFTESTLIEMFREHSIVTAAN